jgi:hypothetical protein
MPQSLRPLVAPPPSRYRSAPRGVGPRRTGTKGEVGSPDHVSRAARGGRLAPARDDDFASRRPPPRCRPPGPPGSGGDHEHGAQGPPPTDDPPRLRRSSLGPAPAGAGTTGPRPGGHDGHGTGPPARILGRISTPPRRPIFPRAPPPRPPGHHRHDARATMGSPAAPWDSRDSRRRDVQHEQAPGPATTGRRTSGTGDTGTGDDGTTPRNRYASPGRALGSDPPYTARARREDLKPRGTILF